MDLYHRLFAINPRVVWPGLLTLLFVGVAAALLTIIAPAPRSVWASRLIRYGASAMAIIVVVQLGFAGAYLLYPSYFDHVEAVNMAVSWLGWNGSPLYPSPETGDIYGLQYGPLFYQANGFFLWLFGPSIPASKIMGIVAFIAAPVLSLFSLRRAGSTLTETLFLTGAQLIVQAGFDDQGYVFGARPDIFMLLIGQAAVFASLLQPTVWTAALFGVLGGSVMDLKLHGALYVAPSFVFFLCKATGPRAILGLLATVSIIGCIILVLPFLPKNASFQEYVHYFRILTNNPISRWIFEQNVVLAATLLSPLLWLAALFRLKLPDGFGWFLAALISCIAITSIVASEVGAGPHHLLPFLPTVAWAFFVMRRAASADCVERSNGLSIDGVSAGLICALLLGYGPIVAISWDRMLEDYRGAPYLREGIAEIEGVLHEYPGLKIAVGPGDAPVDVQRLRVIPVFRGNPLPIDSSSWGTFGPDGVSDVGVRKAVTECRVDLWLLPRDSPFFEGSDPNIFSPAVLADFHATYEKVSSGQIFDQWKCKPHS